MLFEKAPVMKDQGMWHDCASVDWFLMKSQVRAYVGSSGVYGAARETLLTAIVCKVGLIVAVALNKGGR